MKNTELQLLIDSQNSYARRFESSMSGIQKYRNYSNSMVGSISGYFESEFQLSFFRNEDLTITKQWLSYWGSCLFLKKNPACMFSSILTPLIGLVASDNQYLLSKFKSLEFPGHVLCGSNGNYAAGFVPVLWYLLQDDKLNAQAELDYWKEEVGFDELQDDPGIEMIRYEFAGALIDGNVDLIKLCMSRIINKERLMSRGGEQYIYSEAILLPKLVKLLGYDLDFENELIFDSLIEINPLPVYKTLDSYIGQFVDKDMQKLFQI